MDAQVNYRGVYVFKVDATGGRSAGMFLFLFFPIFLVLWGTLVLSQVGGEIGEPICTEEQCLGVQA